MAAVLRSLILIILIFPQAALALDKVRISKITALDGADEAPLIDLAQGICDSEDSNSDGTPDTITLEEFTDTKMVMEVVNGDFLPINFNKILFTVKSGGVNGRTITSNKLAPIATVQVAANSRSDITGFFLKAVGNIKVLPGRSGDQALSSGFKLVSVTLLGKTTAGKAVRIRAGSTFSFSDYDRCP